MIVRDHHILRLEITVEHAGAVQGSERSRELREAESDPRVVKPRFCPEPALETDTSNQLHRETRPIFAGKQLVVFHQIRVAQRRSRMELALKTQPIRRTRVREHLDGQAGSETWVVRLEDRAHPTTAEQREQVKPVRDDRLGRLHRVLVHVCLTDLQPGRARGSTPAEPDELQH